MSDDRRADLEHYIRVAESIIGQCLDGESLSPRALHRDDPIESEGDIRERIYYHAAELGKACMEMRAWLEQCEDRRRPTASNPTGRQRSVLDPNVSERPARAPSGRSRLLSGRRSSG